MPVQAITGLPGSGKSCYAMKIMYSMFLDWARYEHKHGEHFARKLYTNIPLNIDVINETATAELGYDVDLTEQIIPLDEDFFVRNGECWEWWLSFEKGSFVIIDEVQELLPAQQGNDKKSKELRKSFMEYVARHRHKQQDLIFLSQNISNVSIDIRRMIAVQYDVLNVKDMQFGPFWPYQIPMSDIDVVKEAWGYAQQFAHVKRGRKEGNKTVYDKNCEMFLMTPFLYKMYKSHTQSDATTDRPSLRLGKVGSLFWLFRRHGLRLTMATLFFATVLSTAWQTLRAMPTMVMEVVTGTTPDLTQGNVQESHSLPSSVPVTAEPLEENQSLADDKITGLIRGGVITPRGVLRKGDEIIHGGEKDTISGVDFGKAIIYLGSGKRVYK